MEKLKSLFKNKKFVIGLVIGLIVLIAAVVIILLVAKKDDAPDEKELKKQTYTMYVSINPLVKLVFTEEYYECVNDEGEKEICGGVDNKVVDYELLNDDAKDFYHELDFKDKSYIETLIMLCDVARDNKVAFNSIDLITDYKGASRQEIVKSIKEKSKYTMDFEVFVDVKERLVEEEIIEDTKKEEKLFTVKFDSNGGYSIDNRLVKENTMLEDIETPTRSGYKFVEWQLNGKKFDQSTLITSDLTLKAKWQKEESKEPTSEKPTNDKKEENTTKTVTIKEPELKAINLYSDAKKEVKKPYFYAYELEMKVTVSGKKSLVDKINASNIVLGVDMSKYKTNENEVTSNIIVTNPVKGITYKVEKPSVKFAVNVIKKLESTIDKINLNENILVTEWYKTSSYCGAIYVTTNFRDVFKDYLDSSNPPSLYVQLDEYYNGGKGSISESKFGELKKNLIPDKNKLNDINKKFESIKAKTYKNFINFEYNVSLDAGILWYRYDYLVITDYNIAKLPEEFKKYNPIAEVLDDPSVSYTEGPCGDAMGDEGVLLDEALCNKYHLTCARW